MQIAGHSAWHSLYGMDIIVADPSNLIGPGSSARMGTLLARYAAACEKAHALGEPMPPVFKLSSATEERDFLDVRDAMRAYELLLARGVSGGRCDGFWRHAPARRAGGGIRASGGSAAQYRDRDEHGCVSRARGCVRPALSGMGPLSAGAIRSGYACSSSPYYRYSAMSDECDPFIRFIETLTRIILSAAFSSEMAVLFLESFVN